MQNVGIDYIREEVKVLHSLEHSKIEEIINSIIAAYKFGGRIYFLGNGGSSANAAHWVNDIKKNVTNTNNGFDVICLSDNTPLFTAYANDVSYEDAFVSQIEGSLKKEDVIIALSVSGNSNNIIKAVEYAHGINCRTVSIVGDFAGSICDFSDVVIKIDTKNYGIAEDLQQTICHIVSQTLMKFFAENKEIS